MQEHAIRASEEIQEECKKLLAGEKKPKASPKYLGATMQHSEKVSSGLRMAEKDPASPRRINVLIPGSQQQHRQALSLVPEPEVLITRIEPFLQKPMLLYGGYFQTQFKDQFGVLSQEMYKYLKQQNRKMERKQTELEAEIFACRTMIEELMKTNDRLHAENGQKAARIEDLLKEMAK